MQSVRGGDEDVGGDPGGGPGAAHDGAAGDPRRQRAAGGLHRAAVAQLTTPRPVTSTYLSHNLSHLPHLIHLIHLFQLPISPQSLHVLSIVTIRFCPIRLYSHRHDEWPQSEFRVVN